MADYNADIPDMVASWRWLRRLCLSVLLLAPAALANQWSQPESQLARKIAAVTGPGAVAFDLTNRSSLSRADTEEIRRGLQVELEDQGVHFVAAEQAAATVQVFLSENLQNSVWVAEIRQGNNAPVVVLVSAARTTPAAGIQPSTSVTLHKALLWVDDNPILDVAVPNANPTHMIVLQAENAVLYGLQNGKWQQEQSLPIAHTRPWPRDLRGRLALRKDRLFDAYLPGVVCRSTASAPLGLSCSDSDDPWPLGTGPVGLNAFFAPTRNFFTGALSPGIGKETAVTPFYTAAGLPREKYTLWIFSSVDGQVHMLDGMSDQTARAGWGSELASVRSSCGSGWQVLATSRSEEAADTVTAYDIIDREATVASQAMDFGGRITALWSDTDGTSAFAVSRNSETGKYEAYRISLVCNQ